MPLDRTVRRPVPARADHIPRRLWRGRGVSGRAGLMVATITICVALAGCNSGTMNEARQSQAFDGAAETPRLSAQQATRTAETFFAPTGTPPPPVPLPPMLEQLVITLGVGPDGAPSGSYLSVPADAGNAFAAARLRDVRAGQVMSATWTDAFGNVVSTSEVEMSTDADIQWVAVPLPLNGGLGAGEYAVYVFGGGRQLGSLAFSITGVGSGAQLLPDLPANPQVRSTMAPQPERRRDGEPSNGQNQDGWEQQQTEGEWQQDGQQQQEWDNGP